VQGNIRTCAGKVRRELAAGAGEFQHSLVTLDGLCSSLRAIFVGRPSEAACRSTYSARGSVFEDSLMV